MMFSKSIVVIGIGWLMLSACVPIASIGGSAATTHALNGIVYQTFTAPTSKVRAATIRALVRMQIKLVSDKTVGKSKIREVIAKTEERNIEIQLEPISTNTTRMRVTAKNGLFFYDSATAEEIIAQTKNALS